jgi:hypothetical protein
MRRTAGSSLLDHRRNKIILEDPAEKKLTNINKKIVKLWQQDGSIRHPKQLLGC